jgi:hypothetical protein
MRKGKSLDDFFRSTEKLTILELLSRECSYRLTDCSGIRVSGTSGYICQGCLEYALSNHIHDILCCSMCGTSGLGSCLSKKEDVCITCIGKGIALAKRLQKSNI